jgi:glycosyltransferase involved in cell wall biosynthesis
MSPAAPPMLLVIQTHPIQYYAPLYRALAQRTDLRLLVAYLSDAGASQHYDPGFARNVAWDIDLLTGYESVVLQPGSTIVDRGFWARHDHRLSTLVRQHRPAAVLLYGYSSRANWMVLNAAKGVNAQVVYTADSNAYIRRPFLRRILKALPIRWFFSRVDHFLYISEASRAYLSSYGAAKRRMHWAPFAIDVARFRSADAGDERPYDFAWVGKYIPRKRAQDFLAALLELRRRGAAYRALMVGDGPLRNEVEAGSRSLLASGHLTLRPFVNQSSMPALLASAGTFVFTSEADPYGLIATEAAAAGCALVIADRIGCVGRLGSAVPGQNALVFEPGDVGNLVDCMLRILASPVRRRELQRESRRIATVHDVACAAEIIAAVVGSSGAH